MSGLSPSFHSIGDKRAATALANVVEESFTLKKNIFRNIIYFSNDITKKKLRHKGEQHLRYNIKRWNLKGDFDILNDISEKFTLLKLMDSLVNVNYAISILGYWIFDSKYEK